MRLWLVGKPYMPGPENIAIGILGGDDCITLLESIGYLEGDVTIFVADSTDQV